MAVAPPDLAAALAAAAVRTAAARRVVPSATYRLQMHAGFTFRDAGRVLPYLHALGVSHLYLSPVLCARPGSPHGYDVTDPTRFNPEVGTEDEFRALFAAARGRGMGVVLDVVPNHMAVGPANPWWRDVLEHGPASPFAGYFDVAWDDPPRPDLRGRVMLPVLGSPYFQALENDDLKLRFADGAFAVECHGQPLPVDPRTYDRLLRPALELLVGSAVRTGGGDPVPTADPTIPAPPEAVAELRDVLNAVEQLAPRSETAPERNRATRAAAEIIKRRLDMLVESCPAVAAAVAHVADCYRCRPDDHAACDRFDALLEAQAYRLCFWRVASDEINYRRFFDVNELAALSAEREDVFRDTHVLTLRLAGEGLIDGVRVDHPDGLFDPKQYLERLQEGYLLACARHVAETDPAFAGVDWNDVEPTVRERLAFREGEAPAEPREATAARQEPRPPKDDPPLYVVVEKILERSESLPDGWPTAGTTGYEFLNAVTGLFVDPAGESGLTRTYETFTGRDDPFPEVVFRTKTLVLSSAFSGELDVLARQLDRLARKNRRTRDFTLNGLRRALRAVIACFPVYRSYLPDGISPGEQRLVARAVREARRRAPTLSPDLFAFIRDTLLQKPTPGAGVEEQRRFAGKFEQVTAPVTAKGVEDTAFYVYNRLVALNEVGGDPGRFGRPPADVHRFLADRQARQPGALNAGSTHDTKRGEDVRARLAVLSELPDEWARHVARWAELNRPHRVDLDEGVSAPDPNDEYLLYQTLVGAWPDDADTPAGLAAFADRVKRYLGKATHEAKVHTSWINPDPEYDAAVPEFVGRVLDPAKSAAFLDDLRGFAATVAQLGALNSLSQTVLRCTAPGVPDTYQGTELWDLNLVDPDNRRPVDFDRRTALLADLDRAGGLDAGLLAVPDGRVKLAVAARLLRFRREHADVFARGVYLPVEATGPRADHVFAFARRLGGDIVLAAVPRLVAGLCGESGGPPLGRDAWEDTELSAPPGVWSNLLTGDRIESSGRLPAAAVFGRFPVAVLIGGGPP